MKKSSENLSEHTETYFSKIENTLEHDMLNNVLICDVGTQNLVKIIDNTVEQSEKL